MRRHGKLLRFPLELKVGQLLEQGNLFRPWGWVLVYCQRGAAASEGKLMASDER